MESQRTSEYDKLSNTSIIRDAQSIVRGLLHTQQPYEIGGATVLEAAVNYLRAQGKLLGTDESQLKNLNARPPDEPTDEGVAYRLLSTKRQSDGITVTLQQTYWGLPVWESGISIDLKQRPVSGDKADLFQVIGTLVTRHDKIAIDGPRPSPEVSKRL